MAEPKRNAPALRWRWLLPVGIAVALFHFTPFATTFNRSFFDAASRHPWRALPPPDGSAMVLIDDATLAALSKDGRGVTWPPPRAIFAALIAGLERAGASRVALDFVFLDHSAAAEQDSLLAAIAAGTPSVVLARTPKQTPVFWDQKFIAAHAAHFVAPRTGNVDALVDDDGVIRRYHVDGSLAAVALNSRTSTTGEWLRWHGGIEEIRKQGPRVPLLSAAKFIVAGLPSIARLADTAPDGNYSPDSVAQALAAEPALNGPGFDDVRGRIVFVGVNATGTFDQKTFPVGSLEPGVLVHWTAWTNLVENGFVQRVPDFIPLLIAGVFIVLLAVTVGRQSGILLPAAAALILCGVVFALAYVGISHGWFLLPATPVVAAGFGLLGVIAEKFWTERRRRQEVQAMFGSYVAQEIVELLVRDPSAIRLGGERREATVFFCDLAGFTEISEQLSPEELLDLINGYLQETSDCLMAHGAYVDKYIGDAVMAVFGAPQHQPNHALAACRSALHAQRQLALRNQRLAATHRRTLGMRIGINTGQMIVGNLGSERKKNYTVLGDAVNLASRLEGANKEFGTRILLGETTAKAVRDSLVLRPLTSLRVKGKQTAVPVFELVGEPADLSDTQKEFLAVYGRGHALYTARCFSEAVEALQQAAALVPDDQMTRNLLADAREFATTPPFDDWQPILSLKSK